MGPVRKLLGVPIDSTYRFRLGGRPFGVGSSGVRTLKLLAEIFEACSACMDGTWAYRKRDQIRQVEALEATSVLTLVVKRTEDPTVRILAIWLRGRCGGHLGTSTLFKFSTSTDDQTRKEVARSLKRMSAWAQLRQIADCDPNPRIRRIATVQPARPYHVRLKSVLDDLSRVEVVARKGSLFVSPKLDMKQGRRPKPRAVIRAILEHIHRLLAGRSG
jgi:hypothetical protein